MTWAGVDQLPEAITKPSELLQARLNVGETAGRNLANLAHPGFALVAQGE